MKLACLHCGHSFEGADNSKFCSQGCRDSHIVSIETRLREAVESDKSHTSRMSRD